MFTNNYKIIEATVKARLIMSSSSSGAGEIQFIKPLVNANGGQVSSFSKYYSTAGYVISWMQTSASYNRGILFGSGTTPPTAEDYNLGNPFYKTPADESLNYLSETITGGVDADGNCIVTFTDTIQNVGQTSITISEVGIFTSNTHVPTQPSQMYLVFREVLAEPITIEAGATKTITTVVTY